jgi:hypothetical protein
MYVNNLDNDMPKLKPHDDLAWLICFAISVQLCARYAQYCVCEWRTVTYFRFYAHFHHKQTAASLRSIENSRHVSRNTM